MNENLREDIASEEKIISMLVFSLNNLQENTERFDWCDNRIIENNLRFPTWEENNSGQVIELIKCKPGDTQAVLAEIDRRGFMPAPPQFLLGFGARYPDSLKLYKDVISLDEKNRFRLDGDQHDSFLGLQQDDTNGNCLLLVPDPDNWQNIWWFLVTTKFISCRIPTPEDML